MNCADYYKKNGYAVFRSTLPVAQLETTEQKIIDPYDGPLPRHDGTFRTREEVRAGTLPLSTHYGLMNSHLWRIPVVMGSSPHSIPAIFASPSRPFAASVFSSRYHATRPFLHGMGGS